MKKTYTFSWVAVALIALMTLSPNAIFAKRTKVENTGTEIISKRTETSKTFKLEGNQYRSKIGGGALHFKNAEGQWQDFNLNVRSSSKAGMAYENVTNGVQSFFPTTLSSSTGVVVKTGTASYQMGSNFSFSFTNDLSSSSYKNEEVSLNGTSATKLNANKVKYDNGNPLGYIEYEVANNQLKQQFVLRQLPAGAIASTAKYLAMSETISLPAGYNIVANGKVVSGSASAKGHLAITNASGKTVHIIPLPEVFEQNNTGNILYPGGNMPQSYFVNKKANNSYEIKVGVPMSWLNDASRTYPIVIDPTINIPGNWGGWQSSSFGYLEGNPTIYVYTITGSHRAWMKFNTAAIPDNSIINAVELNAFKNNTVGAATMTVNDVTGSYGPYNGGNATVFSDFSNGQYTTFAVNANGIYPNIALGAQASTDLQSKLGSNEFQIALTQSTTTFKRFTSNLSSIDVVYTLCTAPTVTATPSATSACPGNMVTLAGGGAVSYAWTGGITDNTPFAAAATTTTYTVTGTDALSCTATATAVVTINPKAAVPTIVTATPNQICSSGSSVLTATGTNATDSIRWYDATLGGLFIGGTLSGGTLTVNPTTDSTYYAEVKENTAASQTFSYTGSAQTFTVPAGVTSITIETFGAQGGAGMASNVNYGGYSKGTFNVTPSAILNVYAGGQPTGITGGFNGGGTGESGGLGGGGATDVRTAGNTLNDRIIVAGGGGGAGFWSSTTTVVVGGVGGGLVGGDGYRGIPAIPGGMGGTQTSSGNGTCGSMNNPIVAGGFGFGGTSTSCGCDGYGGGGGWYGGAAGGNCRGGGGGSGYLLPSATNTSMSSGVRVGNGQVIITWSVPPANCPSTRVPVTINVDTIPNVTTSPSTSTVCSGDMVTLSGGGGATSYAWTGGITDNTAFSATATTTYTVTGTDANLCSNTATALVTVNTTPTVTASPATSTVCSGDMVTLSGGGATSYAWTGGITDNTAFAAPATTTTYTVTGTDASTCTATATAVVNINPLLTVNQPTNQTLCNGLATTLVNFTGTGQVFNWTNSDPTIGLPASGVGDIASFTATNTTAAPVTATITVTPNLAGVPDTFKTAGATGNLGPTQAMVNAAYAGTNLAGNVTVTGGIQYWTVPTTGVYTIETFGGQGYGPFGGRGAHMKGEFSLTQGDVLKILVGQKAGDYLNFPATTYNHQFGGGGGSFVTTNTNTPLIIAGGGGGSHATSYITTCDGQITTSGAAGVNAGLVGAGGTAGNGGLEASSADGGGGLLSDGTGNGAQGIAFINGGLGGIDEGTGGFGCGGGTSSWNNYRGGGGGGYSGGGGANNSGACCPSAGGGGSFNAGANQTNVAGANLGDGMVIITMPGTACAGTPVTFDITVNPTPTVTANPDQVQACNGDAVTLAGGGASTYSWTGGITDNVSFTPTASTIYTVTGTDASGCSNTATADVVVGVAAPVVVFGDDFETGSISPLWSTGTAAPITSVITTSSAQGIYNLEYTNAATQHYAGLNGTFTPTQVTEVSWWVKSSNLNNNGYVVLRDASSNNTGIVWSYFQSSSNSLAFVGASNVIYNYPTTATNTWYHVELKNWDWTAQTYDIYINNALAQTAFSFRNPATDMGRIHLYNFSAGISNYDDIQIISTPAPKLSNATASNAASVAGTGGGTQTQVAMATMNYYNTSCDLIATLDNNTAALGSTQADVTVDAVVPTHNGQPYTARWYQITPTNTGIGADVTLYYTQDDFDDYNTAATPGAWPLLPTSATDAAGIANVRVTKNDNAGLGTNPVNITPTSVTWVAAENHWEVLFTTPSFSQFRVHGANANNSPLPVVYKNFTVRKEATTDVVEWTTTNERNSKLFNLQRSNDGQYFETLGTVISQSQNGNSGLELNYSFIDRDPQLGHNYYRLEQVDIDNNTSLSKVIDIIWGAGGSTVSIYPNPAKDIINIDLATKNSSQVEIKILDMSGRIVKSTIANTINGLNHLTITLNDIASGIYGVQVYENNKLTHVQKIGKND